MTERYSHLAADNLRLAVEKPSCRDFSQENDLEVVVEAPPVAISLGAGGQHA
jgi:hypothetical protein